MKMISAMGANNAILLNCLCNHGTPYLERLGWVKGSGKRLPRNELSVLANSILWSTTVPSRSFRVYIYFNSFLPPLSPLLESQTLVLQQEPFSHKQHAQSLSLPRFSLASHHNPRTKQKVLLPANSTFTSPAVTYRHDLHVRMRCLLFLPS
jgi:hypothetical protein